MRRTGCIVSLVIALLVAGVVVYFVAGMLGDPRPLSSRDPLFEELVAAAPDESSVLVVRDAGPFWMSLRNDELLGSIVTAQSGADLDLAALLLGKSGLAIWETTEGVGFATNASGARRQILLLASRFTDSIPPLETRDGLVVSRGGAGSSSDPIAVPEAMGDALIRHGSSDESWPPMDPPVVTAILRSDDGNLVLRSVAHAAGPSSDLPGGRFPFEVPLDAAVTVAFWTSAEVLDGLSKVLPIELDTVSRNGVALAVWDVDTDGLLPQIQGVLMVPRTDESQAAVAQMFTSAHYPEELGLLAGTVTSRQVGEVRVDRLERLGMTVDAATIGAMIVVAFDSRSMDLFLRSERRAQPPREGHRWRVVADVEDLTPILADLADDRALRIVARDFQRSVRELESVLRRFRYATVIEADRLSDGRTEVLEMTLRRR